MSGSHVGVSTGPASINGLAVCLVVFGLELTKPTFTPDSADLYDKRHGQKYAFFDALRDIQGLFANYLLFAIVVYKPGKVRRTLACFYRLLF
jgi:hypothetical protein